MADNAIFALTGTRMRPGRLSTRSHRQPSTLALFHTVEHRLANQLRVSIAAFLAHLVDTRPGQPQQTSAIRIRAGQMARLHLGKPALKLLRFDLCSSLSWVVPFFWNRN